MSTMSFNEWLACHDALLLAVVRGDVNEVYRVGKPCHSDYDFQKQFHINLGRAFLQNPVPGMYTALFKLNMVPSCWDSNWSDDGNGIFYSDDESGFSSRWFADLEHVAIHDIRLPPAVLYEILDIQIDKLSVNEEIHSPCVCSYVECAIHRGNESYFFTVLDIMHRKGLKYHPILGRKIIRAYCDFFKVKFYTEENLAEWHTKILCVMEHAMKKGWCIHEDDFLYLIQCDEVSRIIERLQVGILVQKKNSDTKTLVKCLTLALEFIIDGHDYWNFHHIYSQLDDFIKIALFLINNGANIPNFPIQIQHIKDLNTCYQSFNDQKYKNWLNNLKIIRQEALRRQLATQMVSEHIPVSLLPEEIIEMSRTMK